MEAKDYWNLFLETGAPEAYLLYNRALKMEAKGVSEDTRPYITGYGLQ
ncbi:MAG: hypothetical protein IJW94_06235 [Oscillospiraceae bacterium]|nr:hypothetical protein [Oscillospiraceae bacterium]